tara:strand:- start:4787 stop:5668 length:882 start_codon:yes stop_codon:yes gene_type:complete
MKLVLGTAQLGENYGIAFPGKKITKSAFTTILNIAKNNNIFNIDTAVAYGDSLTILGEISVDEMLVISKLPKMPEDFAKKDINSWLNTTFEKMLRDLRLKNIHTLLIHNSADLTGKFSSELINFLHKIKLNNLVKKVGVSIYEPEEIGTFYNFFKPDVIQCPYNIFDQRILRSGWLDKLVSNKVEVHARSIFLQGVLLKNFLELDSYFSKWEDKFIKFENYCYQQQISKLEASIAFVKSEPRIKKILIGVEDEAQFKEIIDAYNKPMKNIFLESCVDINLVNPQKWIIPGQKV